MEDLSDALIAAGALSASIEDANGDAFAEVELRLVVDDPGYSVPLRLHCAALALFDADTLTMAVRRASEVAHIDTIRNIQHFIKVVADQEWLAIARFNAIGGLDIRFGDGGKLLIDFFAGFGGANDVLIQPDGAILAAGSARNGSSTEFALAGRTTRGGSALNSLLKDSI